MTDATDMNYGLPSRLFRVRDGARTIPRFAWLPGVGRRWYARPHFQRWAHGNLRMASIHVGNRGIVMRRAAR